MKKLIITLSIILFVVLSAIIVWICFASAGNRNGFFDAKFVDILNIFLTIVLSGILIVAIAFYSESIENSRRKKDIWNEALSKILIIFEDKMPELINKNKKQFWIFSLSTKRRCETIVDAILKAKVKNKQFATHIENLKTYFKDYFEYVSNNLTELSPFDSSSLKIESDYREKIIFEILVCKIDIG